MDVIVSHREDLYTGTKAVNRSEEEIQFTKIIYQLHDPFFLSFSPFFPIFCSVLLSHAPLPRNPASRVSLAGSIKSTETWFVFAIIPPEDAPNLAL
jgi:hypothetical protein